MVYLQTTYELCFGEIYFESCDFSCENTNIDVSVFMNFKISKFLKFYNKYKIFIKFQNDKIFKKIPKFQIFHKISKF
jgi:hypothetical protein